MSLCILFYGARFSVISRNEMSFCLIEVMRENRFCKNVLNFDLILKFLKLQRTLYTYYTKKMMMYLKINFNLFTF